VCPRTIRALLVKYSVTDSTYSLMISHTQLLLFTVCETLEGFFYVGEQVCASNCVVASL
jgi:hypothetical protein